MELSAVRLPSTPVELITSTKILTATPSYLYGDLTDSTNLIRIIQQVQPDDLQSAPSHVAMF